MERQITDAEREAIEDRERLREAAIKFYIALEEAVVWDENPNGIPENVVSSLCDRVETLCKYIGHSWELDQCGWIDHARCRLCQSGSKRDDYEELKSQLPDWCHNKFSPKDRRYDGWK